MTALRGRTILMSGGSRGIGLAIALRAARDGANVALLAALVVTSVFADGDRLAIGADTAGVAAAGIVVRRGANVIVGVVLAAAVTAILRAIT